MKTTGLTPILGGLFIATLGFGISGCSGCSDKSDLPTSDASSDLHDSNGLDASADTRPDIPRDANNDGAASDTAADADTRDIGRDGSRGDTSADIRDVSGDTAPDTSHPPGLPDPCRHGQGYSLLEFHFVSGGRQSPAIDTWHATCRYSVGNPSCQVQTPPQPRFNGSGDALITTSGDKIRVRFSVDGLQFTRAWVHTQARSYSTTSSADLRIWSPIHGAKTTGPVDNDFTYSWYTTDWTGYLLPGDDPGLTAIDLHADSGEVAIHAVEVCLK